MKWFVGTVAKGSFLLVVPLQYSEHLEPVYAPRMMASTAQDIIDTKGACDDIDFIAMRIFMSRDQALFVGPSHLVRNWIQLCRSGNMHLLRRTPNLLVLYLGSGWSASSAKLAAALR